MKRIFAGLAVAFFASLPAFAHDRLAFWTAAGDHGIDACVFILLPTGDHIERWGQLTVGVWADPETLEPVGKVRLRLNDLPSSPRLLDIGAGAQTLLSVKLHTRPARTATGDVPADAMKTLLRTFVRQPELWVRVDGTAGWTLAVTGNEREVSSCLSVLERDLAEERAGRARGELTDRFPRLQDEEWLDPGATPKR
jgi:hypothetical protein